MYAYIFQAVSYNLPTKTVYEILTSHAVSHASPFPRKYRQSFTLRYISYRI